MNLLYLYLIAPLHTGGTVQEGNLLGIARESHTDLPYIPSSTIRGKLKSLTTEPNSRKQLWGNDLEDVQKEGGDSNLIQGDLWVGDASLLWIPAPSLSHGVIWLTCPLLLQRWLRYHSNDPLIPTTDYSLSPDLFASDVVYLKDITIKNRECSDTELSEWTNWKDFCPEQKDASDAIKQAMLIPNRHFSTIVQMNLWRQVRVKLNESKTVQGGFRYEEAIPPDTLMYLPWGDTDKAKLARNQNSDVSNTRAEDSSSHFQSILNAQESLLQLGGQESLGRGFVTIWSH